MITSSISILNLADPSLSIYPSLQNSTDKPGGRLPDGIVRPEPTRAEIDQQQEIHSTRPIFSEWEQYLCF